MPLAPHAPRTPLPSTADRTAGLPPDQQQHQHQQKHQQQQQQQQQQRAAQRQHVMLDDRALSTLHVLQGPLGDRRGSLLAALDGASTPAGRRLLRQWLCRRARLRRASRSRPLAPARPSSCAQTPQAIRSRPALARAALPLKILCCSAPCSPTRRPLAVASAIEERLAVVDLFREYPTLATGLQAALKRLPDVERLLPRALRALRGLLQAAPGGAGGGSGDGPGAGPGAEEGAGSQDAWLEGERGEDGDRAGWGQPRGGGRPQADGGGRQGRLPAWRALLQARQQPRQPGASAAPGAAWTAAPLPAAGDGDARGPAADPADGAWAAETQQSAWRAVRQLPAALSGLVEAVAVMRRQMAQLGLSASRLPAVNRAVVEAARVAEPVARAARLLEGAEWPPHAAGGADAAAGLRLARGADEAYDAASDALADAEARLEAAAAEALAAFGGAAGGAQQEQQQKPPRGAAQKRRAKGEQAAAPAAAGASIVDVARGILQASSGDTGAPPHHKGVARRPRPLWGHPHRLCPALVASPGAKLTNGSRRAPRAQRLWRGRAGAGAKLADCSSQSPLGAPPPARHAGAGRVRRCAAGPRL
jgi:hypothetical protein